MVERSGAEAFGGNALVTAAAVEIVGGMERLMDVAHELQQEFQGEQTLVGRGVARYEFGGELVELVDDAGGGWAARGECCGWECGVSGAGFRKRGMLQLDVDEMPLTGAAAGAVSSASATRAVIS